MMPYAAFHAAAEALSYDVHVLAQRFNAGFEQVCHRLTTLSRPNARGIPFFMLRVDNAGNVSKRFSSGTFPFSKFGGTCPLWNVHSTFDTPDRLSKQVIELPDGTRYFSIAQMVRRPVAPHPLAQPRFAIGLGCEIRHASKLVYAAGMDLDKTEGTPIGVNCRLCERENCSQRAEPPITRTPDPRRKHATDVVICVLECERVVIIHVLRTHSSYPAHAGYPVRRGLSAKTLPSLEYWIARSSPGATTGVWWSRRLHASVWTITGPAIAVACPANSGARSFSIQASARLLASSACSYLLKMLMAVTVSSGA